MSKDYAIPADAQATIVSVRLVVQSRADEADPWRVESNPFPAMFDEGARRALRVYRRISPNRESRLARQTIVHYDEALEG